MTSEHEEDQTTAPMGQLENRSLTEEMRTSYINYAMSVIIGRALPDARDGLKPVHRRVLYGMFEGGYTHDKKYSKSARSVGEVMGKYHPHGDSSIYETMVRMAQDFSLRYPLVDGQGNFGSIDGDPPAAMRYTESRLDRIAGHMLEDIRKDTVTFQPNFDDSEQEPTVLPSRLPNLLLNGSDGIAVGMATRIPPHNLTEVASAIHLHVERVLAGEVDADGRPNISIQEYMEHVKGPDFPTGAKIHGIDGIEDMYRTGKGRFHVRSRCEVVEDGRSSSIVVHEIPYQVKKAAMLEHIADLVTKDAVVGIRDIRDESSKEGIRVVIEVKSNADPHAVLNQLYASSRLQESYSANMMAIVDGRPVLMTLPHMLHVHVAHREQVIERRAAHELEKAQARAHILEGLVIAQQRIDDVVAAGKASRSRDHFETVLRGEETIAGISAFSFSEAQAKSIAERRLYQLSQIDVEKVEQEHADVKATILDLEDILAKRERRLSIMLGELDALVDRHGDDRRSEIDPMPLSMDREDLIEERAIVITLSQDGYVRHMPVDDFRVQNRGGKGLKGVTTKHEDTPMQIITCFSKDRLLIFTDQGRVYGLKAWEVPRGSRQARGSHVKNLLEGLREDESIISILPISKDTIESPGDLDLVFATKHGRVKRSRLEEYVRINRNGKFALKFATEADSLVSVRLLTPEDHVMLVTERAMAVRFHPAEQKEKVDKDTGETTVSETVRVQGRISQGVGGIKLNDGDHVVGMVVAAEHETTILTITRNGMAKRSRLGDGEMHPLLDEQGVQKTDANGEPMQERDGYRRSNRGTKGVRTMNLDDDDAIVVVRQVADLADQLFLLTEKGMMMRMPAHQSKETKGRVSKGTRLIELRNSKKNGYADHVIFAARLPAGLVDDDEEE